ELDAQHVAAQEHFSEELLPRIPRAIGPQRPPVLWVQRPEAPAGPFTARCEFHVLLGPRRTFLWMPDPPSALYEPPTRGDHLHAHDLIEVNDVLISARAREVLGDLGTAGNSLDVVQALYQHVAHDLPNQPTTLR